MIKLTHRQFLLMLIGLSSENKLNDEIGGITRLQKYAFLLEREHGVTANIGGYEFEPYKAGPYSKAMYDDLEFLENLGLIESSVAGTSSEAETVELDKLTFDDFIDGGEPKGDDGQKASDAFEERHFKLTAEGQRTLEELFKTADYEPFKKKVRTVKSQFIKYSLNDLLYYVYTNYEKMTSKSEIKDQVLRRGKPL